MAKELKDMSLEELWQLFPIILKEHNPNYFAWYEEQKKNLVCVLNAYKICRINHIGSTSVKGLIAKPIVDILLELPNDYKMDSVETLIQKSGWLLMAKNDEEKTLDFNYGYTVTGFLEKVYHLHIKPTGDWGELYFRDYLQKHTDVSKEYELLKLSLKKQFEHNRDAYTNAKSDFILKYTQLAREEFAGRYFPI